MKKLTFLFAALMTFLCAGSMSVQAQEVPEGETDITTLTWVKKGQDCANDFNNNNGGTVFGTDAGGSNLSYVDISEYSTIKLYGPAGQRARLFINRAEFGDNGTFYVDINDKGVATFDCNNLLTAQPNLQYIHLNGVKASAWNTTLNLSLITVSGSPIEFPEVFIFPDGETDVTTLAWNKRTQGCTNNLGKMTGATIWGTDNGDSPTSYVDISEYGFLKVYGPANQTVRAFINRNETKASGFIYNIAIGDDGTGTLDLATIYGTDRLVHLNGLKANYESSAQIDHISVYGEAPFIFDMPEDEFNFTELPLTGARLDNNIGKKLEGGNVIFGSQSDGNNYTDITAFKTLRIHGTSGAGLRIFVNRNGGEGVTIGKTEQDLTIDDKGYVDMDVTAAMAATERNYCHVSSFKVAHNGQTPRIYAITVKDAVRDIPATNLASFSCVSNVKVPEGVAVYTAKADGDNVVLTKVDATVIPANTGVILYGESGTKELTFTADEADADFSDNDLIASSASATIPEDGTCYALKATEAAFATVKAGTTLSINKAYLKVAGASYARLRVVFSDATGINAIADKADNAYYNLQGMKINNPAKGVYINNGKKMIVK